ncbi:hypothetical protein [Micromonospora echinofusca]|uniref:Ig-like domain-containing protein n=1 Tax=Micromonospora echinofusca TaxID=47858 RepID=A0ABS3VN17_MICEH|nr:hypothetical protein [Micromonospora echinofusca]MBO4205774.1 hypothetical protein [Micromonospora echinofusca]
MRIRRGIAAAALALAAITTVPGSAAHASVPAPECESGDGVLHCFAYDASGSTVTWTVSYPTYTTTVVGGTMLRRGCGAHGTQVDVSYSFVDATGQTIYSGLGGVLCNTGPWQ